MKTAKLVLGIISIVLFLVVLLQSCAVGVGNTLMENGEVSGSAGFLLALLMLAGGIVGIAARKNKGGSIACVILYSLAAIIGFANAGSYKDLNIWAGLCVVLAIVFLISIFTQDFSKVPQPPVYFPVSPQPPLNQQSAYTEIPANSPSDNDNNG